MKTFRDHIVDAIKTAPACAHVKHPMVKLCFNCAVDSIETTIRFYFASELRLVLDIALDSATAEAKKSEYFAGFRDAISHLDPNGSEFLDIMGSAFEGEFEQIAKIMKRKPKGTHNE